VNKAVKLQPLRYCTLLAFCLASCAAQAPTAGPGAAPFWIYRDGKFNWAGDYSWEARIEYRDTKAAQPGRHYAIAVTIVGKWGGFQPFAPGKRFDVSQYKYLVYSLKPTREHQVFATGFAAWNDVPDGKPVTVAGPPYGPTPSAGQWASYKIPLSQFELSNKIVQKFTIADASGNDTNLFYVDDVGFTAE
jgi:hypothetical protein